jgi:hypothetical protein
MWGALGCAPNPPEYPVGKAEDSGLSLVNWGKGTWTSAPPFAQAVTNGAVRLRFEEMEAEEPREVLLRFSDGHEEVRLTEVRIEDIAFRFPDIDPKDLPTGIRQDLPGRHALHDLLLDNLAPSELVSWSVALEDGTFSGSFRAPAAPTEGFRAVYTGDTQRPGSETVLALAAEAAPDLWIHGGDIQYQSNPIDTWAGLFHAARPLTAQARFHPTAGNHEYEGQDEFNLMFRRYFAGQGEEDPTSGEGTLFHSFDQGPVRFLALNTEMGMEVGTPQGDWLRTVLADAQANPAIRQIVPYFHRPIYTLSNHSPNTTFRTILHPLFKAYGVRLVLQSHNHVYEHFTIEGITYLVEGGGGASLYEVTPPEGAPVDELAARSVAERSFGFVLLQVDPSGDMAIERWNTDGGLVDTFLVPAN